MTEQPLGFMDHVESPLHRGRMEAPDRTGYASQGGGGASVVIYLRLQGDRVDAAMFESHGCGYTIACGSLLTDLVHGKSLAECRDISPQSIEEALGPFPPHKRHCPALAVAALHDALN